MESINTPNGLVIRGKQRIAVYNALIHPISGNQILEKCREYAPSMTYQDLRHILRDFQKLGIATCLNPDNQTGRLYVLTSTQHTFEITNEHIELCAQLSRAKTRLAILREVARERFGNTKPLTATQIKKHLRESYPLGLNHVLAALKFLETKLLIETVDYTTKRDLKIYQITTLGRDVLHFTQSSKN